LDANSGVAVSVCDSIFLYRHSFDVRFAKSTHEPAADQSVSVSRRRGVNDLGDEDR
jgi:hypothetical protein